MNKKKGLPLVVHKALEPCIQLAHKGLFEIIEKEDSLLYFRDKAVTSPFHFSIKSYRVEQAKCLLTVSILPHREEAVDSFIRPVLSTDLERYFQKWVNILEQYSSVKSFFDDPFLKAYEQEFEAAEILDSDAETAPFGVKQQLFLSGYLDTVVEYFSEKQDINNRLDDVLVIINDAQSLKSSLSEKTKKEVITSLNKIWARCQKIGVDVLKDVFINVASQFVQNRLMNFVNEQICG